MFSESENLHNRKFTVKVFSNPDKTFWIFSYFSGGWAISLHNEDQSLLENVDDYNTSWASLVAQIVKNLPAMRETWVRSLGQEDLLGKAMGTHASVLAWRIPWTEEPGGLQSTPICFSRVQVFSIPWTIAHQSPLSMGILQARTLEWVAIPSSRASSQGRDGTQVTAGRSFTI